jgi:hypothetical protein
MAAPEMLKSDLESSEFRHGVQQEFWRLVEQVGDILFVELIAPDNRIYMAEFDCSGYATEPIRCRFVDADTRACIETAWPKGDATLAGWLKWTAPNFFICWDQDRQGIAHHAEWRPREAWKKNTNKIVSYLTFLQSLLYVPQNGYQRKSP